MIHPSIGRVVWYHPGPNDPAPLDSTQPFAATVCHVWNDRLVNLSVADHNGLVFGRSSVRLAQDDDAIEQYMAQWMPYQVGQAAKAEAAEAEAASAHADNIATAHERIDNLLQITDAHADRIAAIEAMATEPQQPPEPGKLAEGETKAVE